MDTVLYELLRHALGGMAFLGAKNFNPFVTIQFKQ